MKILVWLGLLLVSTVPVLAQSRPEDGGHEFQVWTGGGHSVPGGTSDSLYGPGLRSTVHLTGNLTQALDTLFTQSKVWVGIRATLQAGATSITNGKLVLTDLHAHVVINDKFF